MRRFISYLVAGIPAVCMFALVIRFSENAALSAGFCLVTVIVVGEWITRACYGKSY